MVLNNGSPFFHPSWNYRDSHLHWEYTYALGMDSGTSCMLGKHATNSGTSSACVDSMHKAAGEALRKSGPPQGYRWGSAVLSVLLEGVFMGEERR